MGKLKPCQYQQCYFQSCEVHSVIVHDQMRHCKAKIIRKAKFQGMIMETNCNAKRTDSFYVVFIPVDLELEEKEKFGYGKIFCEQTRTSTELSKEYSTAS